MYIVLAYLALRASCRSFGGTHGSSLEPPCPLLCPPPSAIGSILANAGQF